jgi:hypothetical protein
MSKARRLFSIAIIAVVAAFAAAQSGVAAGGCFNFNNSMPVFFPDPDGGVGSYECAGSAATMCTECITIEPGFQIRDCVFGDDDNTYCHYSD